MKGSTFILVLLMLILLCIDNDTEYFNSFVNAQPTNIIAVKNSGWDTYDLWLNNTVFPDKLSGITKQPFSIQCSGESYLDKSHKDGTTLLKDGDITYEL